ncbi:LysR family transcriptional regulator [Parvibaculum sp.]|uniref:LysR family transcriptional regulator n=1 Tax=Parvibaculum sp. TaxID=2024848 RepID=UPI0027315AA7|nr:LysR family transcriptional regulator [Parvibaculum sp.]MDP1628918.1 LysR family transcriptional regulator [Parvibaculum sp.]MDP2148313.1 LysR family transcriptional regulator [Parvibaculum sp.]MDP3330000.1 LysR family transcriptional regulator [Parvibaculum sp.]
MAVDLNGYAVYAKVVELGGFTAAADALGLSKSMVSRQVATLEDELGVRLLNRTTRRISVTEAGGVVFERAQRIVAEAAEAANEATCVEGAVRGLLRVNAPMSFGIRQLGPVMPEFLARYPDLNVDLTLNDRRVDLIEEGFDVSLRVSALTDSSLIARQLAPVERYLVGAPAYFEKHGMPKHPADVADHDFLLYTLLARPNLLEMENAAGERQHVQLKGKFLCNNADAMEGILLAGGGITLSPDFICHQALASGALVRILPDWFVPPLTLHVIYPHARHLAAKVRAFVDFTVEKFGPGKAPWHRLK